MTAAGGSGAGRDERPDLILVMTDQQRHDNVGYAPGSTFDTPHLDRLAGRGVVFDTAYSGSTVCVPSRISLLTGLGAHRVPRSRGSTSRRVIGRWRASSPPPGTRRR